jgi:glycerate 2-kinase
MRRRALAMFEHALAECSIPRALARNLRFDHGQLHAGVQDYELDTFSQLAVISIGKAGHTMAAALSNIVPVGLSGIVACPSRPTSPLAKFQYFYGGHPLPNADSLRAGDAIVELLALLPEGALVIFLISGGASAVAEKPIRSDLTLSEIVDTYRALVHSGAPITEINAIRKHFSAIKGGRMAQVAAPAVQLSVLVSDVPDHAVDALASGPTMPDSSTVSDCRTIAERYGMFPHFPSRVRAMFDDGQLQETPKEGDAAFCNSRYVTVLSNQTAVDAATESARSDGFAVEVDNRCDDWDYAQAAEYLLTRLRALRQIASRVCLISGGEVTVKVGEKSGVGGRNQHFALYCAQEIAGEPITVLSAGTDGIDGNSPAAGAVVDGSTTARAAHRGIDSVAALSQFDSFPALQSIGDAIISGPTGNNVRDLRILLAY